MKTHATARLRHTIVASTLAASFFYCSACGPGGTAPWSRSARAEPAAPGDGRLRARPRANVTTSAEGRHALDLGDVRDGVLVMPSKPAAGPLPLLVVFHGAGGGAEGILRRVAAAADEAGVVVLAPESRDGTWDAIGGSFGADVAFVDRALAKVFETVSIDPARVAAGGFSDGATYALSLGLINGDLFRQIVAFSPGFVVPGEPVGRPQFFISHGTSDPILPIAQCSRQIVPALRGRGYDVTYQEFDGRHEVPPAIARAALAWISAGTR